MPQSETLIMVRFPFTMNDDEEFPARRDTLPCPPPPIDNLFLYKSLEEAFYDLDSEHLEDD